MTEAIEPTPASNIRTLELVSPSQTGSVRAPAHDDRDVGRGLLFAREYGLIVAAILLAAFFAAQRSIFLTERNLLGILTAASTTSLFAAGEALVVISGGIDLSIAGTATVAGLATGALLISGTSLLVAVSAGLAIGVTVGAVNAFIVNVLRIEPLIATLGTLSVLTGIALLTTNAVPLFGIPNAEPLGASTVLGVPTPILIMLGVYAVLGIVMSQTVWGLRLFAVGGGKESARRAGLNPLRYSFGAFIACGLLSAVAGLVMVGEVASAQPTVSSDAVFSAITAIALAGILMSGGRGNIVKVLVAAIMVALIQNGLIVMGVSPYWTYVTTGVLLVLAVALDGLISRAIDRRRLRLEARR